MDMVIGSHRRRMFLRGWSLGSPRLRR